MTYARTWGHRIEPVDPERGEGDVCEQQDCSGAVTHLISFRYTATDRASGTAADGACAPHAREFAERHGLAYPEPLVADRPFRLFERVWLAYPVAPARSVTVAEADDGGVTVLVTWTTQVPDRYWPRADPAGRHSYHGPTHTQRVARDRLSRRKP